MVGKNVRSQLVSPKQQDRPSVQDKQQVIYKKVFFMVVPFL
jgi:hypothetical protein